jgi:Zn-dependent protease
VSPQDLFSTVVQVAVLLFAVSVHESAHGLVALKFGDTTARDLGRISLNPIRHIDLVGSILLPAILAFSGAPVFGWAKPVPINLSGVKNPRKANFFVSAAGPLSNMAIALTFSVLLVVMGPFFRGHSDPASLWIPILLVVVYSVAVNVSLALFNLLPIPPLDGFGVLESLIPARFYKVTEWMRRFGFIILFVAVLSGGLRYILGPPQSQLIRWLLGLGS